MLYFILGILSAITIMVIAGCIWYIQFSRNIQRRIKKEKEDSIRLSRNVLKGQLAEQMFPIIQSNLLNYHLGDMMFIGKLFDYIIVDGYTDAKDIDGEIKSIIFLDIKTGNAKLSKHQEKLKAAIQAGNVEWKTIRINNKGEITHA